MNRHPPTLPEWLILAYVTFQSSNLYNIWLYSPPDRYGWIAMLIWLLPIAVNWILLPTEHSGSSRPLLLGGLALSLLGALADFNSLRYLGLAISLAGFCPISLSALLWWTSSITWMPCFSYVAAKTFPEIVTLTRLTIATIGSLSILILSTIPLRRFSHEDS